MTDIQTGRASRVLAVSRIIQRAILKELGKQPGDLFVWDYDKREGGAEIDVVIDSLLFDHD